ncbi:hypothetical protein [Streptomyces sp. GS7]|uniref:hypothetical protein n=1 Tax=Streptomyces sp. GS7 TaxID=2692234 RepID=UPI0013197D46|nr:hypothetical protein [Streptomyces sp. GS7]QHC24938.1 hypothetical protein GR130_29770 [Streptomyces sp. GS7]
MAGTDEHQDERDSASSTSAGVESPGVPGAAVGREGTAAPSEGGCYADARPDAEPAAVRGSAVGPPAADSGQSFADCVQCRRPTEHPVSRPGIVLCPVCEWQEAQRSACSG